MSNLTQKEQKAALRFIPIRRQEVVDQCLQDCTFDSPAKKQLRLVADALRDVLHLQCHQLQEAFKNAYASQDPNADTKPLMRLQKKSKPDDAKQVVILLQDLLQKANYEKVTEEDLQQALEESSLFKISMQVDFTEFEQVLLFCRGENVRQEEVVKFFGLYRRTVYFTNFDRVVLYLKTANDGAFLKLFQNVPKADMEMLFPNTKVTMRPMDKLLIGVPAAIGGGIVISTKLGGSLVLLASMVSYWLGMHGNEVTLDKTALITLGAGLAALAAHSWKQFSNFKNRKLKFVQALTENLYFKNLDNNAGVFYRLLDEAEEEEHKEAFLAYYFLYSATRPLTAQQLDEQIEAWLQHHLGECVDFEIEDALQKLLAFRLINTKSEGASLETRYQAVELDDALSALRQQWRQAI